MDFDERQEDEDLETDPCQNLFGFYQEDRFFLKQLREALRQLACRTETTPQQLYQLGKLIFAVDRFPRPTSGLAIELSLGQSYPNGERRGMDLFLDEYCFRLGRSAYIVVDPRVGGDNESEHAFEVEVGGGRDVIDQFALMDWVERFAILAVDEEEELQITDLQDGCNIDWDAEADESDWDPLGSDFL